MEVAKRRGDGRLMGNCVPSSCGVLAGAAGTDFSSLTATTASSPSSCRKRRVGDDSWYIAWPRKGIVRDAVEAAWKQTRVGVGAKASTVTAGETIKQATKRAIIRIMMINKRQFLIRL
jgi:hypothetical protein